MKKIYMMIVAIIVACNVATAEITKITDYETLGPTEDGKFGFGTSMVIQGDELFIGATQNDGRYVNIYKMSDFSKADTISNKGTSFFGYNIAVYDDVLIVGCGAGKKIYTYSRIDGKWGSEAVDEIDVSAVLSGLSFDGKTMAITLSNNGTAELYHIDKTGKFERKTTEGESQEVVKQEIKIGEGSKGSGCFVNGDTILIADKSVALNVYVCKEGNWNIKKQFYIATIGTANITSIAYENGEYIIGDHDAECFYSVKNIGEDWLMEKFEHPSTYNITGNGWGKNVCIKNGILAISTNNKSYPVYLFKKVEGAWAEILETETSSSLPMGWAMSLGDSYLAVSNQNANSVKGQVYIFDISNISVSSYEVLNSTIISNSSVTQLNKLQSEEIKDQMIYDLQGRPVQNPSRGIYIKNHKLIMIK